MPNDRVPLRPLRRLPAASVGVSAKNKKLPPGKELDPGARVIDVLKLLLSS
jgi:hypothetical protein